MVKLPFSRIFSKSVEILHPSNCQFGSDKLIKILTGLDISYIDIPPQDFLAFCHIQSQGPYLVQVAAESSGGLWRSLCQQNEVSAAALPLPRDALSVDEA